MCACHCQSHRGCIPKEFAIHFKFLTDEEKHVFQRVKKTVTSTYDILTLKQARQSPCSWAECVSVLSIHLLLNIRVKGVLICKQI